MAFPSNPTNGQTTTTNNITYVFSSTNYAWTRVLSTSSSSSSIKSTTTSTTPTNPSIGDIWYNSLTDAVYRYELDGAGNSYWIDITGPTSSGGGGTTFTGGNIPNSVSIGSVSTYTVGLVVNTTDAILIPGGTTGQRPSTPANGMMRFNSSSTTAEIYLGGNWVTFAYSQYSINYLIVAGGGGGGSNSAGGGGAGGLVYGSSALTPGQTYTITVGGGGAGGNGGAGTSGTFSSFIGVTAVGGGYGAGTGGYGGSGGGAGASLPVGIGVPGQGNNGAVGQSDGSTYGVGGGGGGAGAAGTAASGGNGGAGGTGTAYSITGTPVYYAGGGGGAGDSRGSHSGAAGGLGGGGAGTTSAGVAGTAGTGGGGGGGAFTPSAPYGFPAGAGGNGIVILSYQNFTQKGTGGTVTSYVSGPNTYWVHTFTTSSNYIA